ncbi:hypothetical protein T11_10837 [Trichinella zimbabwensis]|uniref:Uncharacterized protein n=1 Tax=Trichinella zimbabwensis TaxID=268475 RepID=A0A0V1GWC2_9BILA|nr:hypothetical protein T11_10837 [Trichinella zimbabwensis]
MLRPLLTLLLFKLFIDTKTELTRDIQSFTGNSPVVVEIIASKVGIACVNTLEAARFFTNISGNKHLGASFTGNSPVVVE